METVGLGSAVGDGTAGAVVDGEMVAMMGVGAAVGDGAADVVVDGAMVS